MLAPALYDLLKFVHITGVVMLMGNITVTAIWKFFADRDGRAEVLGFAQKLVTYTDWSMTVWGVVLTMVGGYGMAAMAGWDLIGARWLLASQGLFVIAGLIWLLVIVPIQRRQARMARMFAQGGVVPDAYRRESRRWLAWGLVSTVPLVAATWLMVAKPF
ncbi:DUF2269 family protein [Polymorphobacter fuscus]|uniref:DUF2269 family protein n=1 Tax=Sandarakinorhabdus fusca TaxID=1439888 RepID=A0A7C9GZF3_9SPHN|nr:DUF2269 domain-containing protein [Polymorphobacter fuscus]KAB7643858.1 DUF2269 domain-containing protein [Polymorphobacter fuscus]MQT18554.1 DUF2269 family protein [Polymorphobacter fuscus]NJC07079.1 putative membrane protein [Polymorphobacter fuscus]